jgi:hypothetical protein
MTFSDILTIVGLILTILFGIWGIIITIRKRYPGRITFVEENAIGLFNSIIKSFSEIKIQYNDLPISEQMIYLKASFINTGNIDLSTKDNTHKLKIELPNDYKWINCKITGQSKDIVCNLSNTNGDLIFDFDLLRKNEFIQFEAFAEIKNTDRPASTFRKSLSFSHRIPNTAKVDKQLYLDEEQIKEKRYEFKKYLVFATVFLLMIVGITTYNYIKKSSDLEYKYQSNGKEYIVKISTLGLDKIKIEDSNKNFEKAMSIEEFNSQTDLKAFIVAPTLWGHFKKLAFFLLYVALYLFFMITEYRAIYKDKKIKNIIECK